MTRIPLDPRLEPGRLGEVAPSAIFVTGALILVAVALLLLVSWSVARARGAEPGGDAPDDDGPGGGGPSGPVPRDDPPPFGGGIPLPDAHPATVRLREGVRLADTRRRSPRRRIEEPARRRTPGRTAAS